MIRHNQLNRFSLQKIAQLNAEVPIRRALAKRAGGLPVERKVTICRSDGTFYYTAVRCIGGTCECGCGKKANELEPHEKVHRSQGGILSMENTIMVTRFCHQRLQRNEPMWGEP